MSARRGATDLRGILLVDKPAGMTSHDVVARVRRATGERRVGHAGTLDPAATGLLVVLVGPFTRLAPYLTSAEKGYLARISFGTETDTDDAEGQVTRAADVPASALSEQGAREALGALLGESLQIPPAYSAIKLDGKTAHRVARQGGTLDLAPRPITVSRARLTGIDATAAAWDVEFVVSKGTYIRALARDLGVVMGSAAHLSALRRISSGSLSVADAHTLDAIDAAGPAGTLPALFTDPLVALALPSVEADLTDVSCGRPLPAPSDGEPRYAVRSGATLTAIYERRGERLVPEAVFPLAGGGAA